MEFDFEEAKAKIAKFCGPLPACIVCQDNDWGLSERIFEFIEFHPSTLKEISFPIIILTCNNCKYTISFSAVGLGIVEKKQI